MHSPLPDRMRLRERVAILMLVLILIGGAVSSALGALILGHILLTRIGVL